MSWNFGDASVNFAQGTLNFQGTIVTDTTATAQATILINGVTIPATLTVDVTALVQALQTLLVAPPSPPGTKVIAPSTAVITDNAGNAWGIAGAQVTVNGTTDTATAGVVELQWDGKLVWQQNTAKLWWSKAAPTAAWVPPGGTSVGPAVV